jgi:hypothetical protein
MTEIPEKNAKTLKAIYYDPTHPAGFGGTGRLESQSLQLQEPHF